MPTQQSTIQIRVDAATKREAKKTLSEVGLDISSAVKLFLRNVVITHGLPFEVRTANGFTLEEEARLLKEAEEALRGKGYKNIRDLHDSILNKKRTR